MKQARSTHFYHVKKQANQRKDRPLTQQDGRLLAILTEKYIQLGRSPTIAEVPEAAEIKARFGFWKHALAAANLPLLNDPEQQRMRQKEKTQEEKNTFCRP